YQGGLRFPHLVRDESKPDIMSEIIKPLNPQAFTPSSSPHGFIVTSLSSSRKDIPNKPANVTNVLLSQTEITANCPANSSGCSGDKQTIDISTTAVDPEGDVLEYAYTISGGKIIRQGSAKAIWDLSGVKPGTYTITAAADDGCGFCGKPMTKTVTVKECPNCKK
ncbi:MAG: hypothetical protein ACR2LT_01555, partial [Pyrinomonadaceae bacterium]